MIFVTVGANTPFDRLVRCVDEWAASRECEDVFAQIGRTDYRPAHLRWTERLSPAEFRETLGRASVVVAHAGMGTILSALEAGLPILVSARAANPLARLSAAPSRLSAPARSGTASSASGPITERA